MGALDQIMSAMGGGGQGGQHAQLMPALMKMLSNPSVGGVSGLLSKLQGGGLGGAVGSWIGTGQNQSVSGQQIHQALGDEHVDEVAREAGMSREQASSGLAAMLPGLIDKLSPNGQLPDHVQRAGSPGGADLGSLLGSFFGGQRH